MTTFDHLAYIGLGSNLNHPISQIQQAFHALHYLPDTRLLTQSSLYRSTPLGPANQPNYINAVAKLQTRLPPLTLLSHLQAIEIQQGRVRTSERWGPRTLDLDILLYDQQQSQAPILTLPHPELQHRNFVIYPLYECNPELILPTGQPLQELIQNTSGEGLERIKNE